MYQLLRECICKYLFNKIHACAQIELQLLESKATADLADELVVQFFRDACGHSAKEMLLVNLFFGMTQISVYS